jgi:hypothetical protein
MPFCATWRHVFTYSISYCKDNIKCDSASNAPKCPLNNCVHNSKTCQTLKHFDNVISTCCENVVEVLESLTTSFWTMDTPCLADILGHLTHYHI